MADPRTEILDKFFPLVAGNVLSHLPPSLSLTCLTSHNKHNFINLLPMSVPRDIILSSVGVGNGKWVQKDKILRPPQMQM